METAFLLAKVWIALNVVFAALFIGRALVLSRR